MDWADMFDFFDGMAALKPSAKYLAKITDKIARQYDTDCIEYPIDIDFADDIIVPCIMKVGVLKGRLHGNCSWRAAKDQQYGSVKVRSGTTFIEGVYKNHFLNGKGKIRSLDGSTLYNGYFINGKRCGIGWGIYGINNFHRIIPVENKGNLQIKFPRGLYMGDVVDSIPNGVGALCVHISSMFTQKFLDVASQELPKGILSCDVPAALENSLAMVLGGNSRLLKTLDQFDYIYLEQAEAARLNVFMNCHLKIPSLYFPYYVGEFKDGNCHGKGIIFDAGNYGAAWSGDFQHNHLINGHPLTDEEMKQVFGGGK